MYFIWWATSFENNNVIIAKTNLSYHDTILKDDDKWLCNLIVIIYSREAWRYKQPSNQSIYTVITYNHKI